MLISYKKALEYSVLNKHKAFVLRLSLLLFLTLFGSNTTWATTYVVDINYDGITPASACEQPLGAIYGTNPESIIETSAAADTSTPHTIRICPGTYTTNTILISNANHIGMQIQGTTGIAANVIIQRTVNTADLVDVRVDSIAIQDITLQNARDLIETNTSGTNITLSNLILQNNTRDASIFRDTGININNVTINNAGRDGIRTTAAGDNISIQNTTINTVTDDCIWLQSENTNINNIDLNNCGDFGFYLRPQGGGTTATINDVTVSNPVDDAFHIRQITAGTLTINDINITSHQDLGIYFRDLDNGTFTNFSVTAGNASTDGLNMRNVDGSSFDTILLSGNGDDGMEITNRTDNNTFTNITAIANADMGFIMNNSRSNNVSNSNFSNNGDDGVFLTRRSNDNTFNTITSDGPGDGSIAGVNGLSLISARNNTFNNSSFSGNIDGIVINDSVIGTNTVDSRNNIFNDITVNNNDDDGIVILDSRTTSINTATFNNNNDGIVITNNSFSNTFDDITINNANIDAIIISGNANNNNFTNITIDNAGDDGIVISGAANNNSFDQIISSNNNDDGIVISAATDNTFANATINNNDDGIIITNISNNNNFDNITISNSVDEGIQIFNSSFNSFTNSTIDNNGDYGVFISGSTNSANNSSNNTFTNNSFTNNVDHGARIFNNGTTTNINNTFSNNCFQNAINIRDDETGGSNIFDLSGSGNFYGSIPSGSGYSETCIDGDSNQRCDVGFTIPGTAGSTDNFPLTVCGNNAELRVNKSVVVISDPINATNPKAISGAILRYTVFITNISTTGTASNVVISDDLDTLITSNGSFNWQTDSMIITAPTINSGLAQSLSDATDGDAAEFNNTAGNRSISARCGTLLATEICTLSFEVQLQ